LDKTVLDTAKIKNAFITSLAACSNSSREIVTSWLDEYVSSLPSSLEFDPNDFLLFLFEKLKDLATLEQLQAALYAQENFTGTVFVDVVPAVQELLKMGFGIGVFSEGVKYWQELKLEKSGVVNLFGDQSLQEIHPDKKLPAVISKLLTGSAVVDDKKLIAEKIAQSRQDVTSVWLNRSSNEKSEVVGVHTIHSLKELPKLLRRLWLGSDEPTEAK
jgi:hypothetical protein